MRLLLLNGPNLNLLGTRRPDIYGSTTLADVESQFRLWARDAGIESVDTFQSNHEGDLIDRIHAARGAIDGIVFNPGAYTHTSYALHDALESVEIPTVEVHISNVEEREPWRRVSVVRPACVHTIYGRGVDGYRFGLLHLANRAAHPTERIRYGEDPSQFADLRLPKTTPAPLVTLVHGGFWRHHWTFDTTESIACDLVDRGFAVLNVEYRRIGVGGTPEGMVDDIRRAVAVALDDPRVDGQRWAVVGHSAGGQLALTMADRCEDVPPSVVVTMGGVSDLSTALADDLGSGAVVAFLGGADPDPFSPTRLVPIAGSLIVAHGEKDESVPFEQAQRLVTAQAEAGGAVELLDGTHGHMEYLDPTTDVWHTVASSIENRLRR